MESFSIRAFLAGLAMFVFGMNVLEDSIKSLGYQSLRKRLSHNVNNRIRAMFAGTVLAGILQSGTIVSTMVVAFAGAGILTLTAGIGIIVGANVGGTFLSVIIAKLGFGFSIGARALPLLAVGGILQFIQRRKVQLVGQIILSFGLLLFGIGYLKDSVEVLAATIDVAQYADMGRWVFYGGGIILALLLHSSGTTTIIAMTAMVGGIISFEQAIITMLGASIGSSLVTLYVSFGGSPIKRQVARAHVGFNTLGAIIFLPFVPWVDDVMALFLGDNNTSPDSVARFQVLYNVVAAIIVYPFIGLWSRLMQRWIHRDDSVDYQLNSINKINTKTKKYLPLLQQDILTLIKKVYQFNVQHLSIDQQILVNPEYTQAEKYYATTIIKKEKFGEEYEVIKTIEESLLQGLLQRLHHGDDKQDQRYLPYYEAINKIIYSAKALDDSADAYYLLRSSDSLMATERLHTLKESMVDLYVEISCVIEHQSFKGYKKNIQTILKRIEHSNQELIDLLGKHLHRQAMPGGELSALLDFTSALERSHRSLVEGLEALR